MSAERIVAYFLINGKDVEIRGTILTKLSDKSGQVYYEMHTDKHVGFKVRDQEIKLKAYRTSTTFENSLFVRTDQCVQENPSAPPLPPNHPTAYNGAVTTTERKTTFILGDLITLPLDEGTNRLINGTVGYSGIYKNREVVELCADTKENTSAFICSIRNKYELPDFPDHLRHHDMKGFSLVVDANTVIPHHGDKSAPPPPHRTDSFSQPVSSRRNPDTSLGYPPQDRGYDGGTIEVGSENQVAMIQNLSYQEPLQVVTEYGRFEGYFKCIIEFQGVLHVGVELEKVPPGPPSFWKTPDGVHHDMPLFDCRPGHGALVPINKCRVLGYSQPQPMTVSSESTLKGLPNLFDESYITITKPNEFCPPLNSLNEVVGDKKGIQGHMNSCYMDSSLFGMFAFSSTFDTLFLKAEDTQYHGKLDPCIQRYRDVRELLRTRIVFPLRKAKFVRADQIMMLRTELNNAGTINGMLSNEKDPEEFLKVLLQHVLNAEPYLKLKCENHDVNPEYIYQIFSTKQSDITLPTVQFLLEHSFKEQKIILDSAPHVLLLQMPRFGKDYKVYPRIFPSLQLSLDNLTTTTYGPKCVVCLGDAKYRCPDCEDIKLYYYTSVFVFYCDACVDTVHRRRDHKPTKLMLPKGVGILPPGKMELFSVLTIEKSHYVCFSRCGGKWVMFDSMADRVGSSFGRNIPRVTELPHLEEWLSSPQKMLDWMASDRSSKVNPIPPYVDRITKDNYICMYHSDQVNMF